MKRKEFLAACVGGLAGSGFISQRAMAGSPARPSWPDSRPGEERFWSVLREQFPLTRDRAYLNTGGLGASPYVVIDALKSKIDECERISETGHEEDLWASLKGSAAALLGCDADEIAFMRNTTEGINVVANGVPLKEGDEVILTTHEHIGSGAPWMAVAARKGVVVHHFEPSVASSEENLARIRSLITRRTKVIAVPHIVTTTGLVLPVKEICALARAQGILSFVDGAQAVGMMPVQLHDIGCDAYATSGHKWLLGPKETGLLYVRKEIINTIQPAFTGAYSALYDFQTFAVSFVPTAVRYEYGTVSVPLRCGLGAAIDFIRHVGIMEIWKRDRALSDALYEGLRGIPGVTILSPIKPELRSAMITFSHDRVPYLAMHKHLDGLNLRTRGVSEGGLAALRVSTHIYNSFEEVDRVIAGVRSAA
jgi:cysteine desulfurase / selenocysteine lyase